MHVTVSPSIETMVENGIVGAMKRMWSSILRVLALIIAFTLFFDASPLFRDETDESGWLGQRSGVHVRTDYGTGCQYLEGANGGLSPRLDVEGYHLGCKPYDDELPSIDMSLTFNR